MVFMVFWLEGKVEVMEGDTIADAFMKAGYGGGALKAVDYHAQCELVTWDSLKVGDQFVTNFLGWKIATKTGMGTYKTDKEPLLFYGYGSQPAYALPKVPAHSLRNVAFPDCGNRCAAIGLLGAGECNAVCPWKFDNGNQRKGVEPT